MMGQVSRATNKTYLETGDKPTQSQFEDVLDSFVNKKDDKVVASVDSVSELKALPTGALDDGASVWLNSYHSDVDGGGGRVVYDPTLFSFDDGITFESNDGNGGWKREVNNNIVLASDFGIKTNIDQYTSINSAINAISVENTFVFDKKDNPYISSGVISCPAGITIKGIDKKVVLEQSIWGNPFFDIEYVDDVYISDLEINNTGIRANISGSTRGHAASSYCAGIFCQGNNFRFENLEFNNFVAGIFVSNYNQDGANGGAVTLKNGFISNIQGHNVDSVILGTGQEDIEIKNISGDYSQSNIPPHLVYLSESYGPSYNVVIDNINGKDSVGGAMIQLKEVIGGSCTNVFSDGCEGTINITDVEDYYFGNVIGINDKSEKFASAFEFQEGSLGSGGGNKNVVLDNFLFKMDDEGEGFTLNGTNCKAINGSVIYNNDITGAQASLIVNGSGNKIKDVFYDFSNVSNIVDAVNIDNGDNNEVRRISTLNAQRLITVQADATDAIIEVLWEDQKSFSGSSFFVFDGSYKIIQDVHHIESVTASSTTILRPSENKKFAITENGGYSIVIEQPFDGAELELLLLNNNSVSTRNWPANFELVSSPSYPANGEYGYIGFVYHESFDKWIQKRS